jgi:deoxyribose-phosphate aldolase
MSLKIEISDLAKMIDHSLLHPAMTDKEIIDGCRLALKYNVAAVCIKPYAVEIAAEILEGSIVNICSVTGFPHGNSTISIKCLETSDAAKRGSKEIDTVINTGKVLGESWKYIHDEIRDINQCAADNGAILKVIFENDYLSDNHIIRLCEICSDLNVAFVKTSTGYGFVKQDNGSYAYQGATDHHLKIMRRHCKPAVQIKAAGGIRSLDDLLRVKALGVSRVGVTATQSILETARRKLYGLIA